MSATGVLRKVKRATMHEPSFDLSQLPSPIGACSAVLYTYSRTGTALIRVQYMCIRACAGAESLQSEFSRITLEHEPETTEVEIVYWDSPDNCLPKFITRIPLISKCSLFIHSDDDEHRSRRAPPEPACRCFAVWDATALGRAWFAIRFYAYKIVDHKYFETFILILIGISSFTLVRIAFTYTLTRSVGRTS